MTIPLLTSAPGGCDPRVASLACGELPAVIVPEHWRLRATGHGDYHGADGDGRDSMNTRGARVVVVQHYLAQYQAPFFERLRPLLRQSGVDLVLLYGQPWGNNASRGDAASIAWGKRISNRRVLLPGSAVYWQPCLLDALQADLVIVEQASKLLVNYALLAIQGSGITRMALWGHGKTTKATPPNRLGEAAKTFMSRRAHWWFAYNELSARYVRELGFPAERITAVENAIDTSALAAAGAAVSDSTLEALRTELGLSGTNVCLFVGAMYREKRVPFLIAACELLKEKVPDLEMLFIGSGPDRHLVEEAVARNTWMRYLGPLFDDDKVPYFRSSKLLLMPGGIGLGILDSFALETPVVTTAVAFHGPEIDYLEDGVNGVMVEDAGSPAAYIDRVAALLADPSALARLRAGCRDAASVYTVEDMAMNFAGGVVAALDAAPLRRHDEYAGR